MTSAVDRTASRIRIVEVIYGFGIEGGGAGRLGVELARRLNPDRFNPVVAALWDCGSPLEKERVAQLRREGVSALTLAVWDPRRPYAGLLAACRGLSAELARQPAGIFHSHSEFGDLALLPFTGRSTRLVRTVHNGYRVEWRKRPLRRLLFTNLLYPLAFQREIAVNRGIAAALDRRPLARWLGKQASVIANGIDLDRFWPLPQPPGALREAFHIPEKAFVIGSVGRLAEGKGLDLLLQAAARLIREDRPVTLLIIGEGELRTGLEGLAQELGIRSRVIFTGARADIDRLYSCMDLFVSASLWEGISTVVLESMAAGVPVVATAIPGHQEIIEDGVHGWLVPAGEIDPLVRAISGAIEDPVQRKNRAQQAGARVRDFAIDAIVTRHAELYESLAGR